jgi:YidC/Oxa1 family membrane protein insertase
VSEAPQGKNLKPELRIFIASALSIIVILLWAKFFAPKPPAQTQQTNSPAAAAPSAPAAQNNTASPTPAVVKTAPATVVLGDKNERTIVVEGDLYRVEFSNRGGVVKSWQLKKYKDDAGAITAAIVGQINKVGP